MRSGRLLAVVVVVLAAGTAAACGRTAVVGGDRTLRLALSEYRLTPEKARVSAGLLTISVHNYGKLTHNLTVSADGQTAAATQPLWPGQSTQLTLELTPGRYTLASTLLSDQALGAYGTLTVTR